MAAVMRHWREAATLILASSSKLSGARFQLVSSSEAQTNEKPSLPLENYDILLLKRSSKSKFMPNVYVFPGGVAVDSDFQPGWFDLYKTIGENVQENMFNIMCDGTSLAAPMFSRTRDSKYTSIPAEVAFRICAIRETFEESGVLLAWPAKQVKAIGQSLLSPNKSGSYDSLFDLDVDAECISKWRSRVNSNPDEFFNMCNELNLVPAIWTLYEWSNWLTPTRAEENRRRFDTIFYVCCIDHKPDVVEDKGETVNAQWATPTSILSEHYSKSGGLAPPQVYEISRLLNFKKMTDLLGNAADPNRQRVERLFPVGAICKDHTMGLLPGDQLYPDKPDLVSKVAGVQVFSDSLTELTAKYPQTHRTCMMMADHYSSGNVIVQTDIGQRRARNVLPNIKALNDIVLKAKL